MPNYKLTIVLMFAIVFAVVTFIVAIGKVGVKRNWNVAKLTWIQTAGLVVAYVLLLLVITVVAREKRTDDIIFLIPFSDLYFIIANGYPWYVDNIIVLNLLNLALFVPYGLIAASLVHPKRWWIAFVAGVGISVIIEIVQLITQRGVFDVNDIIYNAIGVLIGCGITLFLRKFCHLKDA